MGRFGVLVLATMLQLGVGTKAIAFQINAAALPPVAQKWIQCGRRCRDFLCVSVNKTQIDVRISHNAYSYAVYGGGRNSRRPQGQIEFAEGAKADNTASVHCIPLDRSIGKVSIDLVEDNCTDIGGLFARPPGDVTHEEIKRFDQQPPQMTVEGCSYLGSGYAEDENFGGSLVILPDGYAFGSTYVSTSGTKHAVFYAGSGNQELHNMPGTIMQLAEHNTRIWQISFGAN